MIQSRFASSILALTAIGGFVLAPAFGMADDHGKGRKDHHDRDRDRDRGNHGKAPKDHGRHDNRDQWWKNGQHRNNNDEWRRAEERRRADEWRRDAERRRAEEWRRAEDRRRADQWNRDRYRQEADHRQQTKNEWRNIAYVSGAVAILGLIKHDKTLTFAGSAGALYSLYRYEQDRKSQNSLNHLRAEYFSRPYFVRDGHRYDRTLVTRNGQRYYQFRRH